MMRAAAATGHSCSQTRITVQPARFNKVLVSASLVLLRASFSAHQSLFSFGRLACSGHECQKQPSTKMATLQETTTMSARRGDPCNILLSIRNLSPIAWRALRSSNSGSVSRDRLARMRLEAAMEEDFGRYSFTSRLPL